METDALYVCYFEGAVGAFVHSIDKPGDGWEVAAGEDVAINEVVEVGAIVVELGVST